MEVREQKITNERKDTENERKKEIRKEGRMEWKLHTSLVLSEQRTAF
jgi:hypothetical protein